MAVCHGEPSKKKLKMDDDHFSFLELPDELLERIFSKLSVPVRSKLRLCRRLYAIEARSRQFISFMKINRDLTISGYEGNSRWKYDLDTVEKQQSAIDLIKRLAGNAHIYEFEVKSDLDGDLFFGDLIDALKGLKICELRLYCPENEGFDYSGRHNDIVMTALLALMGDELILPKEDTSVVRNATVVDLLKDKKYFQSKIPHKAVTGRGLAAVYEGMTSGSLPLKYFKMVVRISCFKGFLRSIGLVSRDGTHLGRDDVQVYRDKLHLHVASARVHVVLHKFIYPFKRSHAYITMCPSDNLLSEFRPDQTWIRYNC